MSALPPKADMCDATRYVRFVPKADIGQCELKRTHAPLLAAGEVIDILCALVRSYPQNAHLCDGGHSEAGRFRLA
jgi:hypothetical protein